MIESYRDRAVTEGQRVFAYRNLHKAQWSLKAVDGPDKGKVVGHASCVILRDAQFMVSEAGRQRVIAEGRKNVHAGVVGTIAGLPEALLIAGQRVTYNPYKAAHFAVAHTGGAVMDAAVVDLAENGKAYV